MEVKGSPYLPSALLTEWGCLGLKVKKTEPKVLGEGGPRRETGPGPVRPGGNLEGLLSPHLASPFFPPPHPALPPQSHNEKFMLKASHVI